MVGMFRDVVASATPHPQVREAPCQIGVGFYILHNFVFPAIGIFVHIHVYSYTCGYMYMSIQVYTCVCVHLFIYVYMYT